ncbi:regulatory signaling modulator protein AmpE [Pseudomonas aeruginosa]
MRGREGGRRVPMQNDANVVHLTRVASEPSPNAGAGRLPVILVQVRDKAALQLKQALQALFDNADDTLFEMADRATSNLEQNAFFEAMRDLRLKRKSIERVYLQKVFEEFSALNQVQSGKSVPTLDTVSFDSLSLVQNEELEESVAVDAMVARVMSRDATALAHLSTRLNTLVGRKVDEKSNPLAPRPLTAAFLDACQGLGVEIKVKLIILKLFEKYVLAHCDQLYAEANQILVAAGVLPELKSALPRRQPAVRPEAVRDAGTLQAQAALLDGGQQEVFGALQELLAQVRDNPSFYRRETPENAAPISSNDLMRLLSHLQQHLPGPGAAEFDVRDGVDQLLQRVSHKSGRSRVVGQVDDDVINLVSMLFEFILDDRTLPDSLKALIGRMQIPMLKVALLDKTFFSRGSHPARRLLNEIASASLGWAEHNDARRDSLYQKIEQVVMRLLNDFVDDPAIFAELLEDFIAFTGDERRRSELLEQRTRDAEEGRAKAELARQDVEQVLNQRLLGKVLPLLPLALLLTLLQPLAYGWLSLPLHLLVVVYSLGRGDVMADLGPFRDAWRREEAQAAFHVAERDLGILGGSESELIGRVHGHLLWQGYQSFFAVIFWYALLGPVAALAYRLLALALEHARQPALREQAARVRHILDWLPVRALVLSFALVGNFLAVIRVLLHWLLAWDISAAALLGKAGRVASDVEAVELGAAGVASLDALWQLLVRAAVLWYAVFAFCALFL